MLEVSADAGGRSLDAPELRQRLPLEVGRVLRWDPGVHTSLEIAIEVLVGIAHFGHREHPDRSMVNAQIGAS